MLPEFSEGAFWNGVAYSSGDKETVICNATLYPWDNRRLERYRAEGYIKFTMNKEK